jgi:RNA polymerase sigma-70 factor (ECF subfamily)
MVDDPEAWGLAALITLSLARRTGNPRAAFVPLLEQDPTTWDHALIAEGEAYLRRASGGPPGRFQLEAAIQAVHLDRARTGTTDEAALKTLYLALDRLAPTLGGKVALATILARTDGTAAGLAALDEISRVPGVDAFQPYWTARSHVLRQAQRTGEAARALEKALALTSHPQIRDHLTQQLRTITQVPESRARNE